MQLHRKADNSCGQIWGVCVRWFSTGNIASLERGNLGFGEEDRFRNFYREKRLLNIDSRTTAESRSRKCSRRDVRRAAEGWVSASLCFAV